jgi:CheY-like chemotaxis protein
MKHTAREILVVDDDEGSRRALTNVLHDQGYTVTAAASVDEAMERLSRSPRPRLIVLDLMMPVKDGWDFRQEQKKDPALAAIPVIAVSAVGKLLDVDISLRKPLDYDELVRAVERYIERA